MSYRGKVILCGDPSVGKTSILARYVDDQFSEEYNQTLGANFLIKEIELIKVINKLHLKNPNLKKDIKEFNQKLKTVETIQKDHIAWTNFFIKFSLLVPDDIGIYNLSLNKDKIVITGLAKTRDQLLKFKENLENSSLFSEVVTPLEDLLKKEDVDFHIKANINLVGLKNYDD